MKYYIKICTLGEQEEKCVESNCCRNTFWEKEIEITCQFYTDLVKHKQVMLCLGNEDFSKMIPLYSSYFSKTTEFTVMEERNSFDKKILICELNLYSEPFTETDAPF